MGTKIRFWDFLFKVGDDYLSFLRNLTPVILFLSLALFALPNVRFTHWDLDNISLALFSLGSLFIAGSVMLINIVTFSKKILKVLHQMNQTEAEDNLGFLATLNAVWHEGNAKQIIFFYFVTLIAIVMVLVYGMNYAFNFYRTISSIGME